MESGSFIRVTRNRPCPICGKPDWCVIIPKDSTNLIYCMRSHDRTNTIGADGNEYVFLKESSDGELFILRQDYKQPGFNKEKFAAKPKSYTAPAARKVDLIQPLSNEKLDLIYKDMLSMLVLDDRHRKYLKAQGWSDELIEKRMVKSYPESDDIYYTYHNRTKSLNMSRAELAKRLTKNHGSLVGVPGYYDKKLPQKSGRKYYECDIDYTDGYRNAKRIIYSNDGLIFYTDDHYESFEQLY